jgi:hypothetical protein
MKLNAIGPNKTEIEIRCLDGTEATVLFSYNTPVAARFGDNFYRTDRKWSVTTSKHINQWLAGRNAQINPQSFFDTLVLS